MSCEGEQRFDKMGPTRGPQGRAGGQDGRLGGRVQREGRPRGVGRFAAAIDVDAGSRRAVPGGRRLQYDSNVEMLRSVDRAPQRLVGRYVWCDPIGSQIDL